MCFDVSIPIRLICSTDGLLCLRSTTASVWHNRCRRGPSIPTVTSRRNSILYNVVRDLCNFIEGSFGCKRPDPPHRLHALALGGHDLGPSYCSCFMGRPRPR